MKKNEKFFLELVKEGVYKIYKNGNIYKCKRRGCVRGYKKCNPVLQKVKMTRGYIQLHVSYQREQIYISAHNLIWIYFNGKIPKSLEMNHKNGIKDDNRISNLELVTHKKNISHAFKIGLNNNFGENHHLSKLKEIDVIKIRKLLKKGITQTKIAKMFNVTCMNISAINLKRSWIRLS